MESSSARPRWQPPFRPLKTSNPVRRDLTVAPTTHKEYVMTEEQEKPAQVPETTATAPRVSLQNIRDLVIAHPGIKRADALQTLTFADGSNKKKVGDLISYMLGDKQLIQTNEDGVKRLHPGLRMNDVLSGKQPVTPKEKGKAESKEKAPAFKLITGEDARPLQQASFPVKKREARPVATIQPARFRCAFFTDGTMVMDVPEHGRIELTRDETLELLTYVNGIADYAANDLNLGV